MNFTWTLSFSAHSVGALALTTSTASSSAGAAAAAPGPTSTAASAPARAVSPKDRIDVSGIGLCRQGDEPARDLLGVAPVAVNEGLALAERRIERSVAERRAAVDCGERDVALDRGELERQRLDGLCQAGEDLGFKPLDIDLDEGRHAVVRDQAIEGGHRNPQGCGPGLAFPAVRRTRGLDEILRCGGDGRVVGIELELDHAALAPDRRLLDGHAAVTAVDEPQGVGERRLRLDRDDAGTEPAERRDPVADMGPDVEHQVVRGDEATVQSIHRRMPAAVAVIDPQRANDAARG